MQKIMFPFILLFLLLQSCKNEQKDTCFFVLKDRSKEYENNKDSTEKVMPIFYGTHNFIIYNDTTIYYHSFERFSWCGTGIDYTKPPHLRITQDSLKQIPLSQLLGFMSKTTDQRAKGGRPIIVCIASPNDTIRTILIPLIQKIYNLTPGFLAEIRRCTEEEEVVGNAKFTNSSFNPWAYKWKSGFDKEFKLIEQIHFLP